MYPRFIVSQLKEALSDTRVVLLSGPRQSGKTTLAKAMAEGGRTFLSFDNLTTLAAARQDPIGFIRGLDRAVIDEVQRVPEVLLAIKESVDEDQRPGRFLLTGSANLMTLPRVADSLAGRMANLSLLPLAQSEILGKASDFLTQVFAGKAPLPAKAAAGDKLVTRVLAGGYPEALGRAVWKRRQDWHRDYLRAIMQRDVRDIAQIDGLSQLPRLLRILAEHSGQLLNFSALGSPLGMNHVTSQKYVGILQQLFLVRSLPPWHHNELKRLTKTAKLHFLDSGLLASLRHLTPQRIAADRALFGAILETFVFSEILKLSSWTGANYQFFHFRDKEQNEVDIVIEDDEGSIVGIEVKAAATVQGSDFNGLRKLAEASGKRFILGLVLCDYEKVVPFGDRLFATSISSLWD